MQQNLSISEDLEAKAGDAILQWIVNNAPACKSYPMLREMAEAYALVRGTLTATGSAVKVEE